jgi:hypothetical protein
MQGSRVRIPVIVTAESGNTPKSVTFRRIWRSRCAGLSGHVQPDWLVTIGRITQMVMPGKVVTSPPSWKCSCLRPTNLRAQQTCPPMARSPGMVSNCHDNDLSPCRGKTTTFEGKRPSTYRSISRRPAMPGNPSGRSTSPSSNSSPVSMAERNSSPRPGCWASYQVAASVTP